MAGIIFKVSMQNDIVRRPVVRPPVRQTPAEDSSQLQTPSLAVQAAERPGQDLMPADSPPASSEVDPAADQAPDVSTRQHAKNPQPETVSEHEVTAKNQGHGLAIAFAVIIFIGLAGAAIYSEINLQKTVAPTTSFEAQQPTGSQGNINSGIGLQP